MSKAITSIAAAALWLVLATGCGAVPQQPGAEPSTPDASPANLHDQPPDLEGPPPVTIRFADESLELEPWTYCYGTVCADGMPPEDPPDVGQPEEVVIEYPLEGWSFTASFEPVGEECGREFPAAPEPLDGGRFILRPAGYPGTYDVTLSGRGDGDLYTTFRWTTTSKGPLPEPRARLAVLADHDGELDSYGVELMLAHLARTPDEASATITVRASSGEEVSFDAERARRGCWPEGTLYWDGPDDSGLTAAELPGKRFTYEVEILLDGERHVAMATWPDDVIRGNEPSVRLEFEPELPALE